MFSELELTVLKVIRDEFQGKIRNEKEFEQLIAFLKHEKNIDFHLFINSLLSIEEKIKAFYDWLPFLETCGLFDSDLNLIIPEKFLSFIELVRSYGSRRVKQIT